MAEILLVELQILGVLKYIKIDIPNTVLNGFSTFNVLNVDLSFLQYECLYDAVADSSKLQYSVYFPLVTIATIILVTLIREVIKNSKIYITFTLDKVFPSVVECLTAITIVMDIIHILMTYKTFAIFDCYPQPYVDKSSYSIDTTIFCFEPEWWQSLVTHIFSLILWVLLPFFIKWKINAMKDTLDFEKWTKM